MRSTVLSVFAELAVELLVEFAEELASQMVAIAVGVNNFIYLEFISIPLNLFSCPLDMILYKR